MRKMIGFFNHYVVCSHHSRIMLSGSHGTRKKSYLIAVVGQVV